ncbi:N/A [soil metagenome]
MGTGHLMRCFALAQAWAREVGGPVTLATAACPAFLERKYAAAGFGVARLGATADDPTPLAELAATMGADWIVLDGYGFREDYERRVRSASGARVLAFDDYGHCAHPLADLVLNQNLDPPRETYSARNLLLGPRYAILREEFAPWRRTEMPESEEALTILITLGGSDPDGRALRLARALLESGKSLPEITLIAGGANPRLAELKKLPITVLGAVDDMPERMAAADLVVAAGGSTVWELALLRRPAAVVAIAPNQAGNVAALAHRGAALALGDDEAANAHAILNLCADGERRIALATQIGTLVDGFGAERVIDAMGHGRLRFRPAIPGDARLLHIWRNEPEVRAASFEQDEIPWDDHLRWLDRKLADRQNCLLLIAERASDGTTLGQVRFDRHGDRAKISLSLDASARGQGLAPWVIRKACDEVASRWGGLRDVVARIRPENAASIRAFASARFVREDGCQDTMRLPVSDE